MVSHQRNFFLPILARGYIYCFKRERGREGGEQRCEKEIID